MRGPSGTPLAYTVTLNTDLELDDVVAATQFKAGFAADVGAALAIEPAHVMVNSLKLGSLVVGFAVKLIPCATVAGGGFQCDYVGDGYCDVNGAYNTAAHQYDGGDCCEDTCAKGSKTPFYVAGTAPERLYACGVNGYDCKRPTNDTDVPQVFDYGHPTTAATTTTTTTSTTTTTTTAEPTNYCTHYDMPYINMTNEQCIAAFGEDLAEYFRDATDCDDCLNATTAHVSGWPQLPQCETTLPKLNEVAGHALAFDKKFDGEADVYTFLCDGGNCFDNAVVVDIGTWCTSAITSFEAAFERSETFNQVSSALRACARQLRRFCQCVCWCAVLPRSASGRCGCRAHGACIVCPCAVAAFNQNINGFNASAVTTMRSTFSSAAAFNQTINGWNTGTVADMSYMFYKAAAFNQNINGFNTRTVPSIRTSTASTPAP